MGLVKGFGRGTRWIVSFLAIATAAAGLYLSAQDHGEVEMQQASADVVAGRTTYQQNCAFCHGRDARGASGPDLLRSALVSHDVNGDLIGDIVHHGRLEKGMPAFQLPDTQVRQIAAYLHSQAKLASTVASRVPTEYPLEKLLVGSADAGKAYFNGAGGCSKCHSPTGDMAHIAAKYKPLELQSRIVFPQGKNKIVTVTDDQGHRVQGEEVYSDEFMVTVLSKDGSSRSWDRSKAKVEISDPLDAHVALLTKYRDSDIHDVFAYLETLK